MGEVWEAYDTALERAVAVKRLLPRLAANTDFRKRFERESRLAARLRTPHVITIHDSGQIDGRLFLTMPLIPGHDLATLLREQGPLTPSQAVAVVSQIASALDAAHAADLVHRDVNPRNILIDPSQGRPCAYLIDFGCARAVSGSGARTITGGDVVLGTLEYMPPEQFSGVRDDRRLDVYALTCVLFEALTARKPFPFSGDRDEKRQHFEHAHRLRPRPRPSAVDSDLPPCSTTWSPWGWRRSRTSAAPPRAGWPSWPSWRFAPGTARRAHPSVRLKATQTARSATTTTQPVRLTTSRTTRLTTSRTARLTTSRTARLTKRRATPPTGRRA